MSQAKPTIQLCDAFYGRESRSNIITLTVKIIEQVKANQFLVADATGYRKIELHSTVRHQYKKKIREQNYVRIEQAEVNVVKGMIYLSIGTQVFDVGEFPVDETKPANISRKPNPDTQTPPPRPANPKIPHPAKQEVSSNMNFGGNWVYGFLVFFIVLVVTIAVYIFTRDDASDSSRLN